MFQEQEYCRTTHYRKCEDAPQEDVDENGDDDIVLIGKERDPHFRLSEKLHEAKSVGRNFYAEREGLVILHA